MLLVILVVITDAYVVAQWAHELSFATLRKQSFFLTCFYLVGEHEPRSLPYVYYPSQNRFVQLTSKIKSFKLD